MRLDFEELDRQETPIGVISVRRRFDPRLELDVHEVKLGDEFLMSSLFTEAETQLARLALAELPDGDLDIVVGGLGLGYTARAVLDDPRVRSLLVVEALDAVIGWHERGLLPLSDRLTSDPRCRLVEDDFFAAIESGRGFGHVALDPSHAVLVDIDHSPTHVLHPSHAPFYEPTGLRRLADRLHPAGVFALWSDGAPDPGFTRSAEQVFASCEARSVSFPNPYTGAESSSTVYVARRETTSDGSQTGQE